MEKNPHSTRFRGILPLFIVIFIDALGVMLTLPILAPLFSLSANNGGLFVDQSTPIKIGLYGLTLATYSIAMLFASPLLGNFSDRIGRKKTLLLCLSGSFLAALLSSLAIIMHSFALFFTSRLVSGLMAGSIPIAQAAIIDASTEHNKLNNISLGGFSYILGLILGPLIGSALTVPSCLPWPKFSTPFFATSLIALSNAIFLVFTFREKTSTISPKVPYLAQTFKTLFAALNKKKIRILASILFFYVLGWNAYIQFIVLHLFQKYHWGTMQLGYFISWIAVIMSISMILLIRIAIRFLTTQQILLCAIITSIIGVIIGTSSSVIMQWISTSLFACGYGLTYPAITSIFSNIVDKNSQGLIMGISSAVMAAASGAAGLMIAITANQNILVFISVITFWMISFFLSLKQTYTTRLNP